MNRKEALAALCDGKKIRNVEWLKNKYVQMCPHLGTVKDEKGNPWAVYPQNWQWEIFKEEVQTLEILHKEIIFLKTILTKTKNELMDEKQANARLRLAHQQLLDTKTHKNADTGTHCCKCCCKK